MMSYSSFAERMFNGKQPVGVTMEIFKRVFPADCDVVVRQESTGVSVIVRAKRPNPVWLRAYDGERRVLKAPALKVPDAELREWLLKAVSKEPGRSLSYYTRLPKGLGGVGASQERKERMMQQLLDENSIQFVPFDKPQGRWAGGFHCS